MKNLWKKSIFALTGALLLGIIISPNSVPAAELGELQTIGTDNDTLVEKNTETEYILAPESESDAEAFMDLNESISLEQETEVNGGQTNSTGWNGFHQSTSDQNWYYYKNGKPDTGLTYVIKGVVNNEDAWWYVEKGQVMLNASTVAQNDYGWWYIKNGKVDFSFDGFMNNSSGWWRIKGGKVDFGCTDVMQGTVNGENAWWFVKGGKVQLGVNSVEKNAYGWWRIENGKVNFNSNTLAQNSSGWWYIKNGKVDFSFNGFMNNSSGWWRIKGGKVDFGCTDVMQGTVNGENAWWFVKGGKVQLGVNSVEKNAYGWWRIENGKVNFNSNTLAQNSSGWWYIKNGKVDFSFNGFMNNSSVWWRIKGGKVDFGCTDVIQGTVNGKNGWWFVKGGKVQLGVDSVEKNANGWWYINNGMVDFSFTGLASNQYGIWYIKNGKVDFNANGSLLTDDGLIFDIKNGSAVEFGEKVVELVNIERAKYGLAPLVSDSDLKVAAYFRATELPQAFSHTRPDGSSCFTILDELDISYNACGENIAGGQYSPEMVMQSWMNSSGHRANILNEDYSKIGVACFYDESSMWEFNWVQLFTD